MTTNPYPNREHPVGKLEYTPKKVNLIHLQKGKSLAMMEYGECELIYDLPRLVGGGNIANLGHASGGSASLFSWGLQDRWLSGHVFSVDTFKGDGSGYTEALHDLKVMGLQGGITLLKGTTDHWGESHKAARTQFSIVFIDADHSYEGVKNDFELWSPRVRPNGLVAFHDTNQEFSNKVLREKLIDNPCWEEKTDLHINRIRVFERKGE